MNDYRSRAADSIRVVADMTTKPRRDWKADRLIIAITAQAEATLALVEQQRLANIIALGKVEIYGTFPFRHLILEPADEYSVRPTEAMREGLGL